MGSNVTCLRTSLKTNTEPQRRRNSSEMPTLTFADGEGMKHRLVLQMHHEVLKQMVDPKGFLLTELLSRDVMDERDRQWIKAEKRETEMNVRLVGWLMENDANTFSVFLDSLRACHQQHIANLLEGKDGDRILTEAELEDVASIEPLLVILLDTKAGLVDMLCSCDAISKTDYQRIFARSTDYQINRKLFKVLMRSSNVTWEVFFRGLRETKQAHLLKYFDHGAIISAKVEVLPRSCRHVIRERVIMDQINDITRHLHLAPVSRCVADNQLVSRLFGMGVECVCIHVDSHIVFYFYCPSSVALAELWQLHQSGQLLGLVYDLFNVKSLKTQHTQFRVDIAKADYKTCKRRLDSSAKHPIMNLCEVSSSNTSQPTKIQHLSASLVDLILLKSSLLSIQSVSPQKAYVNISSVCSTWKTSMSKKDFVRQIQGLIKTR